MIGKGVIAICLVGIIMVTVVFLLSAGSFSNQVSTDTLHDIQKNPPSDYIDRLENVIISHKDPAVRQQAVFSLADIAISNNETERITGFLKDRAMQQEDPGVMNAAYANLDLINRINPPAQNAFFEISVREQIRKGKNITMNANVSVLKKPYKTLIGIQRVPDNITLLSDQVVRVDPSPGSPKNAEFTITLDKTGTFCIPVKMLASYDRVDADLIKKNVCFTVSESSGSHTESEEPVPRM